MENTTTWRNDEPVTENANGTFTYRGKTHKSRLAVKVASTKARNAEYDARLTQRRAEAAKVVASGVCPDCGTKLVRNSALTGWWQCGAYGEPSFRQSGFAHLPHCSFQCFTA